MRLNRIDVGLGVLGLALVGYVPAARAQHMPEHSVAAGGHMDRHFDDAEKWAKEFDDPGRDQWQVPARVIASLGLKRGAVVADLGAGTGYFSVRLARSAAAPKVFGVDIEDSMNAYLKKRVLAEGLTNVTAVHADADSPNLPEPVDLVLIVDTYHHIADREKYFRRLASALKPGGRIAIIDWRKGGPMGPPDEFRFTPEELKREMAKAGYAMLAQYDYLPSQMFVIFGRGAGK